MLSMSVEHANQLRQLIAGNIVPNQLNQLTHILQSLSTIASVLLYNPKSFSFICQLASTKKILFHETASACHITPLGHLERPREGYESMTKPASGTFTNSTALRQSQGLHLVTDHEYTLLRRQSSFIAEDTRPAWVSF